MSNFKEEGNKMLNLTKIEDNDTFENLKECIEETTNCSALVRVRQYMQSTNDETFRIFDVLEIAYDCTTSIVPYKEYMYLTLKPLTSTDIEKTLSAWNTVMERSEERFEHNLESDYILTVDLVKQKQLESLVYTIAFASPEFVSKAEEGVQLVFKLENLHFAKETIDFVEIYDELEYEEEEERFEEERENRLNNENGESDNYISSDEFINNDKFLL